MNIPTPLTPYVETAKLILAILLGCALLFAGQKVLEWKQAADQNEQRGRTMEATGGIQRDGDSSSAARQDADAGTAQARDDFEHTTEEDRYREPETATRDSGNVPASRLRAFEQRRIARERLAADRLERAGIEREAGPRPKVPSER